MMKKFLCSWKYLGRCASTFIILLFSLSLYLFYDDRYVQNWMSMIVIWSLCSFCFFLVILPWIGFFFEFCIRSMLATPVRLLILILYKKTLWSNCLVIWGKLFKYLYYSLDVWEIVFIQFKFQVAILLCSLNLGPLGDNGATSLVMPILILLI